MMNYNSAVEYRYGGCYHLLVVFFKQKTAYEMRISDWSPDVCSSDLKKGETAAMIQFEMISKHPYRYTTDDVLFQVYAEKNDLTEEELPAAREQFFSKGQPCFRASPLPKRYGWGVHSNQDEKVALYGCETPEYQQLSAGRDPVSGRKVNVYRAMRSSR